MCNSERESKEETIELRSVVKRQALHTISEMAGGPGASCGRGGSKAGRKLNVLMGGDSLEVDAASGRGIEELGTELVAIIRGGLFV